MDKINTTENAADAAPAPVPRAMSRRRFASAGLGGAGALLTIVSAPAMAASATCASPSGTLSGDLYNSHNTPSDVVCGGLSHGYYKNAGLNEWTAYHNVMFGAPGMFNCVGKNLAKNSSQKTYSNATLLELIKGECGFKDENNLGMQFATVWLNIKLGKINFLKMSELQGMWNETQMGGYTPRGGVKPWSRREVAAYLQRTFT